MKAGSITRWSNTPSDSRGRSLISFRWSSRSVRPLDEARDLSPRDRLSARARRDRRARRAIPARGDRRGQARRPRAAGDHRRRPAHAAAGVAARRRAAHPVRTAADVHPVRVSAVLRLARIDDDAGPAHRRSPRSRWRSRLRRRRRCCGKATSGPTGSIRTTSSRCAPIARRASSPAASKRSASTW